MRWFALAIALVLASGCEEEKEAAAQAELKAECRRLEDHIVRITPRPGGGGPETDPARIEQIVAKLPVEDLEQCAAIEDRKVIACMQAAGDVPALRACIPTKKD